LPDDAASVVVPRDRTLVRDPAPDSGVDRATTPVVGVVVLLAVTVCLVAVVVTGALAVTTASNEGATDRSAVAVSLSVRGDEVTLTHEAGPPLDVESLVVRVGVNGTPLRHQPPVPFFAARGFRGGPSGPFNPASDGTWSRGETASFRVAGTNAPALSPGRTVSVTLARGDDRVATLTATVRARRSERR
jgi:FlaG/FlaF family flagellin (archaellin)